MLNLLLAGAEGGGLALAGRELAKNVALDWLDHPEEYIYRSEAPLAPAPLRGTFINSPFLYFQDEEKIGRFIEKLDPFKGVNMFIDDRLQNAIDSPDNEHVLSRISYVADMLHIKNISLTLTLLDGYTMKNTRNIVYGYGKATSPYIKDGIHNFYTNPKYTDAFYERIRGLAPTLSTLRNLVAVTVVNEPPCEDSRQGKLEMVNWYRMFTPVIHQMLPEVAILPGIADPYLLPDDIPWLAAMTAHLYPPGLAIGALFGYNDLANYIRRHKIPVAIQEAGVPEQLFGIELPVNHDRLLAGHLREILFQISHTDMQKKEVSIGSVSISPWKLTDGQYDGFPYNPKTYTKCNQILSVFSRVAENLTYTPEKY
jgi:hypothetical protein